MTLFLTHGSRGVLTASVVKVHGVYNRRQARHRTTNDTRLAAGTSPLIRYKRRYRSELRLGAVPRPCRCLILLDLLFDPVPIAGRKSMRCLASLDLLLQSVEIRPHPLQLPQYHRAFRDCRAAA